MLLTTIHLIYADGACGYENLVDEGIGLNNGALSPALFNNGLTCGACFELKCINIPQCRKTSNIITGTNWCEPTHGLPANEGKYHFDLSMYAYGKLATSFHAGILPVQFRRVPCVRKGGIRFAIKGHKYWFQVLVYNVAGAGDVKQVSVKGSGKSNWVQLKRSWGQRWETAEILEGMRLSFRVTTSDGRMVESRDCAPANWKYGQVFQGKQF